jgi:hypothetical protein
LAAVGFGTAADSAIAGGQIVGALARYRLREAEGGIVKKKPTKNPRGNFVMLYHDMIASAAMRKRSTSTSPQDTTARITAGFHFQPEKRRKSCTPQRIPRRAR